MRWKETVQHSALFQVFIDILAECSRTHWNIPPQMLIAGWTEMSRQCNLTQVSNWSVCILKRRCLLQNCLPALSAWRSSGSRRRTNTQTKGTARRGDNPNSRCLDAKHRRHFGFELRKVLNSCVFQGTFHKLQPGNFPETNCGAPPKKLWLIISVEFVKLKKLSIQWMSPVRNYTLLLWNTLDLWPRDKDVSYDFVCKWRLSTPGGEKGLEISVILHQ